MRKSDLKTGMLIQDEEGKLGLVMLGTSNGDIIAGNGGSNQTWFPLDFLNEDLISNIGTKIVKVYSTPQNNRFASFDFIDRSLIWERMEPKEMTVEEIEAQLGYKIKITE